MMLLQTNGMSADTLLIDHLNAEVEVREKEKLSKTPLF